MKISRIVFVMMGFCLLHSESFTQVTQQWAQRYNGPGNSVDEASFIVLDGAGNVYVTGWSRGTGTSYNFATIKYSQTTDVEAASSEISENYSLFQKLSEPVQPKNTHRILH